MSCIRSINASSSSPPNCILIASYSFNKAGNSPKPAATASKTCDVGSNCGSCGTYAMRRFCCMTSKPSSNLDVPAITFNSDDLPVPLRPINPTRSPISIENSVLSSKATCPKANCAFDSEITAINFVGALSAPL